VKKVNSFWLPDADEHFVPSFEKEDGFQLDRLDKALTYVKDWTIAVDGGAHVGSWSKRMAEYFGMVYSFEPAPDTYECLELNLKNIRNVTVANNALGDRKGYVHIAWEPRHRQQGNTGGRYIEKRDNGIQMIDIDSLKLSSLGFLKLDVEGAEYLALKGAEETIKRCHPVILIEVKKNFGQRFGLEDDAPINFLLSLGAKEIDRIKADRIFSW